MALNFNEFNETKKVKPNTIVCKGNSSGNQWSVKTCGINAAKMIGLTPGQNLTDSQLEELKSKKWDVRYADEITPKSNGPKSSGKAGVPQSD